MRQLVYRAVMWASDAAEGLSGSLWRLADRTCPEVEERIRANSAQGGIVTATKCARGPKNNE